MAPAAGKRHSKNTRPRGFEPLTFGSVVKLTTQTACKSLRLRDLITNLITIKSAKSGVTTPNGEAGHWALAGDAAASVRTPCQASQHGLLAQSCSTRWLSPTRPRPRRWREADSNVGAGERLTPLRRLRFDPLGWWRRRPGCW